jgi:A/G-specific adenine glycosylase
MLSSLFSAAFSMPTDTYSSSQLRTFAPRLIAWQRSHGRHDLPWQNTSDPYRVWLSEIMLQQTQVATVTAYYQRFIERYPSIADLAAAPLPQVLELWAGLGYYARARNLHACAQAIVAAHGGSFPRSPATIAELPGIGRSTAAAIAAFSFGTRAAILDGNVKRVLCRAFGIDGFPGSSQVERRLWALAETLLPSTDIESYTQGLMDLGSLLCRRGKPDCAACSLRADCVAYRDGRQGELPAAKPRKAIPERHSRVLILSDGERLLLERRPPSGIWGGLLALPECVGNEDALAGTARLGHKGLASHALPCVQHVFTHFKLTIEPWLVQVAASPAAHEAAPYEWITWPEVGQAALPAPLKRLLLAARG